MALLSIIAYEVALLGSSFGIPEPTNYYNLDKVLEKNPHGNLFTKNTPPFLALFEVF